MYLFWGVDGGGGVKGVRGNFMYLLSAASF